MFARLNERSTVRPGSVVEDPLHFKLVAIEGSARSNSAKSGVANTGHEKRHTFSLRADTAGDKDVWVAKLRGVCSGVDEVT